MPRAISAITAPPRPRVGASSYEANPPCREDVLIRKEKLSNGLTLITESMPDVRSICVGVWLRRGSRHEPSRINGISHFIEHLVFKGTQNRTAREIALTMDSVGGQMDAFTSKEYTCFYAKVLDSHLEVALDLLGDILRRPRFDPVELERERKVVLEEIQMVDDTPDDLIYDMFFENFYPRNALGRPIQGTAKSVGGMSRRQLLNWFGDVYRPENLLVVAAGNVKPARLKKLATRAFGDLSRGKRSREKVTSPRPRGGVVTRNRRELAQMHLLLGVPAFPEKHRGRFPLYVFNTILGGTMSSRLFQKIREERGLAYSVYSALNAFVDSGFLNVYLATSPEKGNEAVRLVLDELRQLRDDGPTPDELTAAKEHLKGSLMLSLESTGSRMSNLARQEIYYGKQFTLSETLGGVENVSAADVRRVARKLLTGARPGLAAVGRVGRLKIDEKELRL